MRSATAIYLLFHPECPMKKIALLFWKYVNPTWNVGIFPLPVKRVIRYIRRRKIHESSFDAQCEAKDKVCNKVETLHFLVINWSIRHSKWMVIGQYDVTWALCWSLTGCRSIMFSQNSFSSSSFCIVMWLKTKFLVMRCTMK